MLYTRNIPTVEGYYFKRHTDLTAGAPQFRITETVVYVGQTPNGWRVQHDGPKQGYVEYGIDLNLYQPQHTEWSGPIPFPEN